MKHKIYYRFIVAVLSLALSVSIINDTRIRTQAFAPAIPIVWELLQTILLSAGVTYLGYETFQHIRQNGLYSESIDSIKDALNAEDAGLGDAVIASVSDVTETDKGNKVVVPENVWNRLLGVSKGIAINGKLSTDITQVGNYSTPQSVVDNITKVPDEYLPIGSDGTTHIASSTVGAYQDSSWNKFKNWTLSFTGTATPLMTVLYCTQKWYTSSGHWSFVCIVTENNVPIARYNFTMANYVQPQGTQVPTYAHFYDAAGNELAYTPCVIYWNSYYEDWRVSFGSSNAEPRKNWSWENLIHSINTSSGEPYVLPVIQNSTITLPAPVTINSKVEPTVIAGGYDVVTPGRTQTGEGTLAGDVTITVPTTFPIADNIAGVIAGEIPITDTLPKVDVIPVDTTTDKVIDKDVSISDAIAGTIAPPVDIGGVDDFNLMLVDYFPFCIPFDFVNLLQAFNQEPEAPSYTFEMPTGFNGTDITWTEYTIDLSMFNDVAYWCRKGELILFILGLIFLTRQTFIRS